MSLLLSGAGKGKANITVEQVLAALPWHAFYWAADDPSYSEDTRVSASIGAVKNLVGDTNKDLQGAATEADRPFWNTDSVTGKKALHFVDSGDRVFRDTAQWGNLSQPSMSTWLFRANNNTDAQTVVSVYDGSNHDIIARTATDPKSKAAYAGTVIRGLPSDTNITYIAAGFYNTNDSQLFTNNYVIGLDPAGTIAQRGLRIGRDVAGGTPFLDGYVFGGGIIKDGSNRPHQLEGWATWERFVRQEFPDADPIAYSSGGSQKVVIMGDSILDQPQTEIEAELSDKALLFNAMGASQAADWLPRASVIGDNRPDVLVLCIGTNDLNAWGVSQSTLQSRYVELINRVSARKTICFTLYTGPGSVQPSAFGTFNTWLTSFVATRSDCVIYDWNTIGTANGWIADGYGHPTNPTGRQALADGIEALIEA